MGSNFGNWDDSTLDLAIRAFTVGVDPNSLRALRRSASADDLEQFENSLAAIHWSHADLAYAPSVKVLERLIRDANAGE